jgi:hypothetical protein
MFYDTQVQWMVGILVYNWVTLHFYRNLVSKQDETIANLMVQQKEH